ncbi:MAG: hypothetical protein OHK0039_32110 [Bacteroidia bacterium]
MGESGAAIHAAANRQALDGEVVTYTWSADTATGKTHFQTTMAPIKDAQGQVQGLVGISRDITPLVRAEQDYHDLFNASPLPQWIYDMETFEIVQVNDAAIRHYGYSREEFTRLTIKDIRPREDVGMLLKVHEAFRHYEGILHYGIFTHQKKDGTIIRVQISGHRLWFQGRDCEVIVSNDITGLEAPLHALEMSNQRYELVNQATNDLIYDWDIVADQFHLGGNVQLIPDRYPAGDETDLATWLAWVYPEDREPLRESLRAWLADETERHWTMAYRLRRLGEPDHRYVRARGYLVREAGGRPLRMIGSVQDIDASYRMRLKLEDSYRKLRDYKNALDQSTNIIFTDTQGIILDVNESTCELSGYTREELIGQHTRINKSGYHPQAFFQQLWARITQGREWRGEIKNRRKAGSMYWVDTTIVPLLDEDGVPYQYLAIRTDITARKLAEEKMQAHLETIERQNTSLREIAWTQSHVVRAPLARMMAIIDLIQNSDLPPDEQQTFLQHLLHSASELDGIVRDLSHKAASLSLPETTEGHAPSPGLQLLRQHTPDFTCLLVDDDAIVLKIHHRMVVSAQFHDSPLSFTNGRLALDYLLSARPAGRPCVVFLDINMPVMDGWTFLDEVSYRGLGYPLYVFVTSSSSNERDYLQAAAYPCVAGYLEKPLSKDKVAALRAHAQIQKLFTQ